MTVKELRDILKQYPEDVDVHILGFKYTRCDWESWHSDKAKIEYSKDENILYLEGEIYEC